jgi:hypothetical protein
MISQKKSCAGNRPAQKSLDAMGSTGPVYRARYPNTRIQRWRTVAQILPEALWHIEQQCSLSSSQDVRESRAAALESVLS